MEHDPPLTTVVFDLGGVLIDWDPNYLYTTLIPDPQERERFLSEVCTFEWNHTMDAGVSVADAVADLTSKYPDDAALIHAWSDRWPEMLGGEISDNVGIVERLSDMGVRLLALTNFAAETWPHALTEFAFLTDLFEGIVVSGQERTAKPGREIFDIITTRYGLEPKQTAFIDDSWPNVETATALGFRSHHYSTSTELAEWIADQRFDPPH